MILTHPGADLEQSGAGFFKIGYFLRNKLPNFQQKWALCSHLSGYCDFLQFWDEKNHFWYRECEKTHPNYPQTKGFVLKPCQNKYLSIFQKKNFWWFFEKLEIQKSGILNSAFCCITNFTQNSQLFGFQIDLDRKIIVISIQHGYSKVAPYLGEHPEKRTEW